MQPPNGADAENADERNLWGWFEAGVPWWGDFGDPFVVRDGDRYLAFASASSGRHLPVTISQDLGTWVPRPRWSTADAPYAGGPDPLTDPGIPVEIRESAMRDGAPGDVWNLNDALVRPAPWALEEVYTRRQRRTIWAPGVVDRDGTWFAFYAVRTSLRSDQPDGRFCISVATAPDPEGPYRDDTIGPVVCDDDPGGSLDPEPFVDPETGEWDLLWKAAGRVGSYPSSLKSARLGGDGRRAPGAAVVTLLETDEASWEGETIENPSMAWDVDSYLLFYSGNRWTTDRYATGVARCPSGPRVPCERISSEPLLSSTARERGPGGASAFRAADGQLLLAYAVFTSDEVRPGHAAPPRRLRVGEVQVSADGSVRVRWPADSLQGNRLRLRWRGRTYPRA